MIHGHVFFLAPHAVPMEKMGGNYWLQADCYKMKEATNSITRGDAPHSAIAKLRRDMNFNVVCRGWNQGFWRLGSGLRVASFKVVEIYVRMMGWKRELLWTFAILDTVHPWDFKIDTSIIATFEGGNTFFQIRHLRHLWWNQLLEFPQRFSHSQRKPST